eukprot:CAMPEP_0171465626 /NCGR_PEP_ID=MMETSP0945-20130129/8647_1 /TAXON_ID=109269 /ORGANISM="Vaucheria litorea, Strain CCMP2940" /LENGTH=252 /DNA_ID=CAMNT_0011993307 /DNA_START=21 /DNA_END=779 /DNA_ORIENTATION=-
MMLFNAFGSKPADFYESLTGSAKEAAEFTNITKLGLKTVNKLPSTSTMMLFSAFGSKPVDFYENLTGSAKEAAEYANQNIVPLKSKDGFEIATFAAGCFWGIELAFQRAHGVEATHVGYTQGQKIKPTYEEVCSGKTGHTEAVQVFLVSYNELLNILFQKIDPTQVNGQGNDNGTQYRTGVYPHSPEQRKVAEVFFESLKKQYSKPIATELVDAAVFFPAEKYHQQYLSNNGRFGTPQSAEKGCTDPIRCYG